MKPGAMPHRSDQAATGLALANLNFKRVDHSTAHTLQAHPLLSSGRAQLNIGQKPAELKILACISRTIETIEPFGLQWH
jgi:hypothetical protein